jgi:AbrB family looped-hinge helix DNA binding protein
MAITLTVTSKGQVTLRKEVLEHLGVRPGERIEIDLLPAGGVRLRPTAKKPISSIFGKLATPGAPALSIEEINRLAAEGWAGKP